MDTRPFEIQPVVVGDEDVVMTTWDDPDATFGVYERDEDDLAEWLADYDRREDAEAHVLSLLLHHRIVCRECGHRMDTEVSAETCPRDYGFHHPA